MAATPVMAYETSSKIEYNTSLGNANVKLASVEDKGTIAYAHSANGGAVNHYKVTFLVRNCTYDKNIVVHYEAMGYPIEWRDSEPAKYVATVNKGTNDEYEIWEADVYDRPGNQFCVWYKEVDSWDNNNGVNYQF